MTKVVNCPNCGTEVVWSAETSPWRPFCSERCRLIDLGEWASESHRIEGASVEEEPFSSQISSENIPGSTD